MCSSSSFFCKNYLQKRHLNSVERKITDERLCEILASTQFMKMNSKTTECYFLLETPAAGSSEEGYSKELIAGLPHENVVLFRGHFLSQPTRFSPLEKILPDAINRCNGLKISRGKYTTSFFLINSPFFLPLTIYIFLAPTNPSSSFSHPLC